MAFKSYYKLVKYENPNKVPFYLEDVSGQANKVRIEKFRYANNVDNVEISNDLQTWTNLGSVSSLLEIPIPANGRTYVRSESNGWGSSTTDSNGGVTCFAAVAYPTVETFSLKVGGNIMSLLYGSNFTGNETSFPTGTTANFAHLFDKNENNNIANGYVTDFSELILPATTLTNYCYFRMFYQNTAITSAPAFLPATTLANYCYNAMFSGCTNLTAVPALLPATTLTNFCYENMFYGCTSLTQAPSLPATTLAEGCYHYMFGRCTSLTAAPALPATTLAGSCYQDMFHGCTSLTTAPVLPATTLVSYCYYGMFYNCTSLTQIEVGFTAWPNDYQAATKYATMDWTYGLGATGTFIKPTALSAEKNASGNTTYNQTKRIPYNWTVQDAQ